MSSLSLEQLLEQQLQTLKALVELQHQELKVLEKRDAPALEALTEQKTSYLNQLEQNDQLLAAHEQASSLKELHPEQLQSIQEYLEQVQSQNEINGQIIRLSLGRTQTLKHNLHQLKGDSSLTYDGKGRTQGGLTGPGIKA